MDDKKNPSLPDYRLSTKIGEKFVDIGAGWIKEGTKGKYISFKLNDVYKERPGFAIVLEEASAEDIKINLEAEFPDTKNSDGTVVPF